MSSRLHFPLKNPRPAKTLQPRSRLELPLAKSGSDWTLFDLKLFNISLTEVDPLEFFAVKVRMRSVLEKL